jgi:hypothetical protein
VHVVGACPSRGSQAIALGFDIGGRVAGDARNEKPARGMPLALLA